MRTALPALLVMGSLPMAVCRAQEPEAAAQPVSFAKDIAPILVGRCMGCHGDEKPKGGFSMYTFDALLKGVFDDPVVEAGKPEESILVEVLQPDAEPRMPQMEDPLPEAQRELIARWVKEGAKFDGPSSSAALATLVPKAINLNVPPAVYQAPIAITAMAFSPDGAQLATGGYHEVLLWDVATGKLLKRLQGLPERTYAIRFSPNGWWIATTSGTPAQSGVVRLWDAETGEPIRDLLESEDSVFGLAFSSNSKLLAAGGTDRTIRIWDMASGKLAQTIEDHADWVLDLDFSSDGQRLVSASRDKTSKVFDVTKGESLVTFPDHKEPVYAAAFTHDGKAVATAGADRVIKLWNPNDDGKKIREISGHDSTVFRLEFTPDGKNLLTCSADKTVRQFNPADGKPIRTLKGHEDWVYSATYSPDGKLIATGSWDGEVRIWKADDGRLVRKFIAMPTKENSADVALTGIPEAAPSTATAQLPTK